MTGERLLHIRDLRKTFDADLVPVRALRGVDLDVRRSEFVAVRGPSGCGKSTLLHLIAGLDTPDGGEIEIAGEQIVGRDGDRLAHMRRRHIGMVFQFFNLIEDLTAIENVTMSALIAGTPRRSAIGRSHDLVDLLGIADKADEYPVALSGGQKQRLAIARALANEPTLLLADEPTGALDTAGGAEIVELFRRLQANHGQTVIMVTHSGDVAAAADRVVTMRDGRIAPGESSADRDTHGGAVGRRRSTSP